MEKQIISYDGYYKKSLESIRKMVNNSLECEELISIIDGRIRDNLKQYKDVTEISNFRILKIDEDYCREKMGEFIAKQNNSVGDSYNDLILFNRTLFIIGFDVHIARWS